VTISRALVLPLLLALCCPALPAQSLSALFSGNSGKSASAAPVDPLGRGTPRTAVQSFLEACHNERYVEAARFLDLQNMPSKKRNTAGPELAKDLADLLDRDAHFEIGQLSDAPTGTAGDGLPQDRDQLISVALNGSNTTLYLERENIQSNPIWLVSQDSAAKLSQLSALEQESPLEQKLPEFLVANKLLGTSLWIWIGLVAAALILSLVSGLLSRIVIALFKPIARRYANTLHSYRLETFTEPLRLLLSVTVFRAVIEFLDPSALLRDYLLKLLTLLFALGAASLLMRIIDVIFDQIQSRLNARERALTYSVLPLGARLLKVFIICVFILFTLSGWGYNTTTILAGVGVGGLAVALAAQKTIENFFGGVSVITDRPVLVGDFCQFGGQVGTVEDIGLRSTRIRTLARTLVTIPNSQFSTMTLENYSRRDRMWFHPTLHLRRDTPADKVEIFMEKIIEVLKDDPLISIGGVPLRFSKIDEQAFNIEIFAYVLTDDFDKFLATQTKLLLEFLRVSERTGIAFAIPIVESVNARSVAVAETALSS
jgi:MscS family membrane protein